MYIVLYSYADIVSTFVLFVIRYTYIVLHGYIQTLLLFYFVISYIVLYSYAHIFSIFVLFCDQIHTCI